MSELPKLDNRNFEDLLREVKFLAKQYTPEWNFDENSSDVGVTFSKVFCNMMENTISKYNKTAYNYYLVFLNMLGTKLRPAESSSGMVVVESMEGNEGSYVEKGTPLFVSSDNEDGMIVYETIDSVTAIDTNIKAIYFTDGKNDFISRAYENSTESKEMKVTPFRIFDNVFSENLQKHEIYFADEIVFDTRNTDIVFSFYNKLSANTQKLLPEIFSDSDNVSWEYYDSNEKNWKKVDSVEKHEFGVRIKFKNKTGITTVMDKESRFIRCRFNRIPNTGISLTSINYHSISQKLPADAFYNEEIELSNNDFYPFNEEYILYNSFAIKSDEIFSKKGATIKLSADLQFIKIKNDVENPGHKYKMIMNETDFGSMEPSDMKIESVLWEYWNGKGWARLEVEDKGNEFFKPTKEANTRRELKFKCPNDIDTISIGSSEGYFIRARISKINQRYNFFANYITPYVNNLEVEYVYENEGHKFENLIVKSDLSDKVVDLSGSKLCPILEKYICDYPAMYLCLSKPLVRGMIRIFFDIEEGVHRFNPVMKWEYLAKGSDGTSQWKHMEVIDGTDNFSHSETIAMIGKNDFEKSTIFGTEGYFVRILNPDGKYSSKTNVTSRPVINNIIFNTVGVIQKNTRPPEYFSIERDEQDKVCKLSNPNVSSVEVWVNEFGVISDFEQDNFMKYNTEDCEPKYDELGQLEELWIKWKPVLNLVSYGINDRVYEIDYPKGEILFGNGKHGKIPPEQYTSSIQIRYSICNGTEGNVDENMVNDFVGFAHGVQSVTNPTPMMGGVDMETVDLAAKRVFSQVSGGNRLVSLTDFEDSICFNDRNIYKVKCLSHVDEQGKPAMGVTSIAVLPKKFMQGYEKFKGIRDRIWNFIDKKAPASLSSSERLRVFEVGYVETSVSVDVVIGDFNLYQNVYSGIESKLKNFLDPINGNFSGRGWGIGEFPRKEFIYNYIKTVPNIKWIRNINIFTKLVTAEGKREVDFEYIKEQKFVVPVYGTPEINISVN